MPILVSLFLNQLNPRKSIRASIIWNTAGMVLAISLLLSLLVGYVSGIQIETAREQSLEQLAYQMADKLERGMFERYKDIQILSTLESIRQLDRVQSDRRNLLEKLQDIYPDYAWIGLTDTQGNIVASTGGLLEGKSAKERPWFQLAQTEPYVGDVHEALLLEKLLSNPDSEPIRFVDVATPVTDIQNKFKGVLCAHLSWTWAKDVRRSLIESTAEQNLVEIFVTSQDGHVLLAPEGFESELTIAEEQKYLTASAQTKGYRSYPGLNWVVVVRQSKDVAFAPVRSLQTKVLATGLLLGSLFAGISWLNARRISAPIIKLSKVADRIRQGEEQVKIPTFKGLNELSILSQSLIYAIGSLNEQKQELVSELDRRRQTEESLKKSETRYRVLSETLETQVKQRTKRLQARQHQLEREILERQKAEQAAEAANRSKSMFLANMSHELRTPLNAILGFSQLMSRNIAFNSSQQENLGIINRSGKHLLELINDILDMSKIEAGKITLHENGFNLDYLLDDLEAMFSLRAKSKGLSLEFERGDKVPQHIKADEKKLRQVLINLLGNAIKFTKVGGITLRVKV